MRVDAVAAEDLRLDQPISLRLRGRDVFLVRTAAGVSALDDRCPHAQQSLATGKVQHGRVTCRHHGVEIELATGRVTHAMGFKGLDPVAVFAAVEQAGRVYVELP